LSSIKSDRRGQNRFCPEGEGGKWPQKCIYMSVNVKTIKII
jgi:hypothetical protein